MTCGLDYSLVLAGKFRVSIRNCVLQLYFARANRVKSPTLKFEGGAPSAFLSACWVSTVHYERMSCEARRHPKIDVWGALRVIRVCDGLQGVLAAIET